MYSFPQTKWSKALKSSFGLGCLYDFFLFFFNLCICNWRMIAAQYCVAFCRTLAWISHRYTYVPSLWRLPPRPTPLGCHRALGWALRHTAVCTLAVYSTYGDTGFSVTLSIHPALSFPHCVTSVFSMSVSPLLSCKQAHQDHLSRFHIHVLIYSICFSLSGLTSLCIIGSRFIHLIGTDSKCIPFYGFE